VDAMHISERGQVTIPKALREQYGMNHKVEVELTPTPEGLLIRRPAKPKHPVDRVFGILGQSGSTDAFLADIRGR